MKNKLLYYMMADNINEGGNYLDRFVPIIEDCIEKRYLDGFTVDNIRLDIENEFRLNKPTAFYEELLNYMVGKGKISLVNEDGSIYYTVSKGVRAFDYEALKEKFNSHLYEIASSFIKYQKESGRILEIDEARDQILGFIDSNLEVFNLENVNLSLLDSKEALDLDNTAIACFLIEIYEKQESVLNCLETIIKAVVCFYYVYLEKANDESDFGGLKVFLDSPLIINLLGYNGKEFQTPILELVKLLQELGATVTYFDHTVSETLNILSACERKIRNREAGTGPAKYTVEYFLKKEYPTLEIINAQKELEKTSLPSYGVFGHIEDVYNGDEYNLLHMIDEKELSDRIGVEICKDADFERAEMDAKSIAKVCLIRQGVRILKLSESRAIFLTMNRKLAEISSIFLGENRNYIPCTLMYSQLTLLLLAVTGSRYPDIPFDILLANCYSAVSPPDQIWSKYVDKLNSEVESNNISEEQYVQLRSMGFLQNFAKTSSGAYESAVHLPIKDLTDLLERKKREEIMMAKAEGVNETKDEFIPQLESLNKDNEVLRGMHEKLMKDEQMRAEKYAKSAVMMLSIVIGVVIIGLNLGLYFFNIFSGIIAFFAIVVLGLIGVVYKDSLIKKTKQRVQELHLKKHGKVTNLYEKQDN